MNTVRALFVLGLSVVAVACSAPAEETETDTAAQTAPPFGTEVSADARGAASALLHMTALLTTDPEQAAVAPFKAWVLSHPTATFVEDRGAAGRTYYFDGDVIVEGDVVDATLHLVIEETTTNPEEGPRYSAKLSNDPRPATAKELTSYDARVVRPIVALASLAISNPASEDLVELEKFAAHDVSLTRIVASPMPHGSAVYTLDGSILQGDIIVGDASLRITEMQLNPGPGPDILEYLARGTRTLR